MNVYQVSDLFSRKFLDANATKPAKFAVVGFPVAHSASPIFQQAALDAASIDARYIRLEVQPNHLKEALAKMQTLDFMGCNITVPHKNNVVQFCDELRGDAITFQTVNTIKFETGRTIGFNTDGSGFAEAITESFGKRLEDLRVVVLGAGGGAGKALAIKCILAGVKKLVIVNRTAHKIKELACKLYALNPQAELNAITFEDPALPDHCAGCDLIVNATSVGLKAGEPCILPPKCLRPHHFVYDTIYNPALTPLLVEAIANDCRTANGLSMLLHQGALAFQSWFPGTEPLAVMRRALEKGNP